MDGPVMIVVRGVGDVGSAVAHRLFVQGYAVVIHDVAIPATIRRGMAFADAIFDGQTVLEGVRAARADDLIRVRSELTSHRTIPIYVGAMGPLLADVQPSILVDARVQKHGQPEVQRGLALFTVGHASFRDATRMMSLSRRVGSGSARC